MTFSKVIVSRDSITLNWIIKIRNLNVFTICCGERRFEQSELLTLGVNFINILMCSFHAKMLWRSTSISPTILFPPLPGVNFTNTFMLSFYARRSRKRKNTYNLAVYFTHLGSLRVKAVRRKLMKSTPEY